jgi:hypothetical protein
MLQSRMGNLVVEDTHRSRSLKHSGHNIDNLVYLNLEFPKVSVYRGVAINYLINDTMRLHKELDMVDIINLI